MHRLTRRVIREHATQQARLNSVITHATGLLRGRLQTIADHPSRLEDVDEICGHLSGLIDTAEQADIDRTCLIDLLDSATRAKPSIGRLYDLYLGGDHWFEIDRDTADRVRAMVPEIDDLMVANRHFLHQVAKAMAHAGVRQFLEIGAGPPTRLNTHEVIQAIDPAARMVYVDNDPEFVHRAKSVFGGLENVAYIAGDFRDPQGILDHPRTRELIDLEQPLGYLMVALIHFIPDQDNPAGLVRHYLDTAAPDSQIAISHFTADGQEPAKVRHLLDIYRKTTNLHLHLRSRHQDAKLFQGLALLPPHEHAEPGLVRLGHWADDDSDLGILAGTWGYCGIAHKK